MNIDNFKELTIKIQYKDIIEKYCKELSDDIKDNASHTLKGSGEYAAGWTFDIKKVKRRLRGVVFNKDHYRLTHLLEKGHNVRNGYGRTKDSGKLSYVAPRPHIKPAFDKIQKKFIQDMATAKYEINSK